MNTHARTFAGRKQAGKRRSGVEVHENAAHGIVHPRPNGDRLLRRIDAEKMLGELANLRKAFAQLARAEVAHVRCTASP